MRISGGIMDYLLEIGLTLFLTVLTTCVGDTGAGDVAPCYDCLRTDLITDDQALHERLPRQVNNQCQYPCRCTNREHHCRAGVNMIKDGCNCCYMCARQQGDMCDYKDKCDEEKGFYCDFKINGGARGICRAKNAKPCDVEGKIYKDGEEFKPDCRRLCSCQNGQYACSTLCPQEESRPSSVHCKNPKLINISGKCCREWTCPPHDHTDFSEEESGTQRPISSGCIKESTAWSACSQSCGMGISVRVTNDNADCEPVQQRRLCLVRPCELNDQHLKGKHCKSTWKSQMIKLRHGDCESTKEYRPKFCSTCKRRKCCGPGDTKTKHIEFRCKDGRITREPMMWIRNCHCHDEECPWRSRRWLLGNIPRRTGHN